MQTLQKYTQTIQPQQSIRIEGARWNVKACHGMVSSLKPHRHV